MKKILDKSAVVSVYSGRNNVCCCGCAGTHYYNSKLQTIGTIQRGYKVENDELNDRMITKIVNLINNNPDKIDMEEADFVSIVIGKRLYIAYGIIEVKK
jgi:hypothetical protein